MPQRFDEIATSYAQYRRPDPRIAAAIANAVGHPENLLDVGSGTGSYSPRSLAPFVVAVEPSIVMIRQRAPDAAPVVRAVAEALPFRRRGFDVAMAIFTVHHWSDPRLGLLEMMRVAARQVVLTWDHRVHQRFWLLADYLPELAEPAPNWVTVDTVRTSLRNAKVEPILVPWDCLDGFGAAYWRRPEMYLDARARQAISGFALCPPELVASAMARLDADLKSGEWARRHRNLERLQELDAGYRLVTAGQA
jgi:SAM-dependent methyltransferase